MCPTEHIKCRLQVQHGVGAKDYLYKGPFDAVDKILKSHGLRGLYRGFICTAVSLLCFWLLSIKLFYNYTCTFLCISFLFHQVERGTRVWSILRYI